MSLPWAGAQGNEIEFPDKPFYIDSRLNTGDSLTVNANNQIKTQARVANAQFQWIAKPDVSLHGYVLVHLGTGNVLTRSNDSLSLAALSTGNRDQLWRIESLDGPWCAINSNADWEKKINVYGSDLNGTIGLWRWDGGDNEKWSIRKEEGELTVDSIEYHVDRAVKDFNQPPTKLAATFIDNSAGSVPITSTVSLARTVTTSRTVTTTESNTVANRYVQSFGAKGGVKDVWEVNASFQFEQSSSKTISLSDSKTDTTSDTDTTTLQVVVPAGKRYRYQIAVYYAHFSIPFTAHMTFRSNVAGAQPQSLTVDGTYDGVSGMRSEVEVAEMPAVSAAPQAQPQTVERLPLAEIEHKAVA